MKTIFALFTDYSDAKTAVDKLLDGPIERDDVNVMVQADVAKEQMPVNMRTASVNVTDEVGEERVQGLDNLVSRQQPVQVGAMGDVYAAGPLATTIVKAAAASGKLSDALHDFDVPREVANEFSAGVERGDWLVYIRSEDNDAAHVLQVMKTNHGQHLGDYS